MMRLSAARIAEFDRQGYLYFPALFEPAEMKPLTDEVPHLFAMDAPAMAKAA
jgi:ectoine hydroxylase